MRPTAFSIAISGLTFAIIGGTAQAAPVAPLPPELAGNASAANISPVYYRHHWRHRHRHYGYGPTASYWDYYRVNNRGRGTSEESTR